MEKLTEEQRKKIIDFLLYHFRIPPPITTPNMKYKVSIYRDDSVTTVVYDNVKHVFMTANNSVLTIAQWASDGSHYYIHWPRERFCWYKVERTPEKHHSTAPS